MAGAALSADVVSEYFGPRSFVMAGLVPAISLRKAMPCHPDRDGRDKPGHDELRDFGGSPPSRRVGCVEH